MQKDTWRILERRNEIYGICAIWILFFHVHKYVSLPYIPLLSPFIKSGNAGVDIFLLLSGYCLCLSYSRNSNLTQFYLKRFSRVLVPYLVFAIPYFIWSNTIISSDGEFGLNISHFLKDLTGVSLWLEGDIVIWYVHAIIAFYLLFPILFKLISKALCSSLILLFLLIILIFICNHYFAFCRPFAIVSTRLPVFILGIIMACYRKEPQVNSLTISVSISIFILFVCIFPPFLIINKLNLSLPFLWISFMGIAIPTLYSFYGMIKKASQKTLCVLKKIGDLSFEVYIVHILLIQIANEYNMHNFLAYWEYPLIIIITYLLAWAGSFFSRKILSL